MQCLVQIPSVDEGGELRILHMTSTRAARRLCTATRLVVPACGRPNVTVVKAEGPGVCDSSVMSSLVSSGTNVVSMMIGEKADGRVRAVFGDAVRTPGRSRAEAGARARSHHD